MEDYVGTKLSAWLRMYSTEFAAIVISIVSALLIRRLSRKRLRLPPRPPGWPVLGHLLLLGKLPHRALQQLATKYGPIMLLKLGAKSTVIISSAQMAEEILKTSDHIFASRASTLQGEIVFYKCQDLIFGKMGEHTSLLRKTCSMELFTAKRTGQFKGVRREEMVGAVERMLKDGRHGGLVDVDHILMQASFNNITRLLFSQAFFGHNKPTDKLSEDFLCMSKEFVSLGWFGIAELFPWLRRFDLDGYEGKLDKARIKADNYLQAIIDERRRKPSISEANGTGIPDFTDVLLRLQSDESKDFQTLTDEAIKGLLLDLLFGGTDTSVNSANWTLAELLRNPEIMKKVRMEIDSVVGIERLVDEADIPNLPYLQAVISESMRMHPVAPLFPPRRPIRAVKVAGYDIPDNINVMVNSFAMMRDPSVWQDPEKFDPDRFVDSAIDHKGRHFDFIPFGSGRRMCPGMNLGMVLVQLMIAHLVQMCEISLPESMKPEDVNMDEKVGIVLLMKHTLECRITPRLPATVYVENGIHL